MEQQATKYPACGEGKKWVGSQHKRAVEGGGVQEDFFLALPPIHPPCFFIFYFIRCCCVWVVRFLKFFMWFGVVVV